jgi:ATP-dependent RNA helicase DHX36
MMIDPQSETFVPLRIVAAVVAHIVRTTEEGAILILFPGHNEILRVERFFRTERPLAVNFQDPSKFKILRPYSKIPIAQQSEVFDSVAATCRKIILATNIAETFVTIPDLRYVIDTSKVQEQQYARTRRSIKP